MKKLLLILISFSFLAGCNSLKEGLTLQKKTGTDEFLVKKKNPLVLPPKFSTLPNPDEIIENNQNLSSTSVKELIKKGSNQKNKSQNSKNTKKIEQNILDKIKNK